VGFEAESLWDSTRWTINLWVTLRALYSFFAPDLDEIPGSHGTYMTLPTLRFKA